MDVKQEIEALRAEIMEHNRHYYDEDAPVISDFEYDALMRRLEEKGVPTHYVEELSDRETAVKKVSIVPLEVIIRNISAGSFAKRYGVEEGIVFDEPERRVLL